MTDDIAVEQLLLDDEFGYSIVAEPLSRNIDSILSDLQTARGAAFVTLLKEITKHPAYSVLKSDPNIYTIGGEMGEDYDNLLNAARKAVEHGYRVFILPNPKGFRTADFVFERKGVYKMFDLKTITGKNSVGTRLVESIGQSNRVLLNMPSGYNTRLLAADIKTYFELNEAALEVLIFKGKSELSIYRRFVSNSRFYSEFKGLLLSAFTWNVYRIVKLTFDAAKIGINSESSKFWSDYFHLEANFFA